MSLLVLAGLAVALFAVTNIDDLFILAAFLADRRFTARQVTLGQYLGFGVIVAASVAVSLATVAVPVGWVRLLGLLPIAIGAKKLADLRKPDDGGDVVPGGRANVLAVAAVTLANGGDNVGVYAPVFATRAGWEVAVILAVFVPLVFVWVEAARYVLTHQRVGGVARRYGHALLPAVLIGLGVWIVARG